jgi:hypothetical protein
MTVGLRAGYAFEYASKIGFLELYKSRIREHFVEVCGHNLEFSDLDFLNHREGDMDFLLSPLQCTVTELREFEEIEISRQSCRGDCE